MDWDRAENAPFPADKLVLNDVEAERARAGTFSAAIVLHTTTSDWSRQELAGIVATLGHHCATVVEIVDCGFDKDRQNKELLRLAAAPVDAVISLPIGSSGVLEAHRAIARAGKKLVLLDNAPSGLRPGVDYLSVSSADNFGLGAISAELTSPYAPHEGVVGILTYEAEFFVTNEREIAFRKWMGAERPDVTLVRGRFGRVEDADVAYERLLAENDDLDCVFVAWDMPALQGALGDRAGRRKPAPRHGRSRQRDRRGAAQGRAAQRASRRNVRTIRAPRRRAPPCWA